MNVEGAVSAGDFRVYDRNSLLPALSAGDIPVMGNLSACKNSEDLGLLKEAGAKVGSCRAMRRPRTTRCCR